jgi:hypothetical protein
MKTLLVACLLVAAATATAQSPYLYVHDNEIGLYTDVPTADNAQELACHAGPAGSFTAYAIVTNPRNERLDRPIGMVGAFEFRIEFPAAAFATANLPPYLTLFSIPPDYFCGGMFPVQVTGDGYAALLMSFTVMVAMPEPGVVFIRPVREAAPTFPGFAAIADAEDDFQPFGLHPVSGSYDAPVFALYDCGLVVPNTDISWGGVKALYR